MPLASPLRIARVVCEIDKLTCSSCLHNALTKLDFPAPDGADITNILPFFIGITAYC